MSYSFSKMSLSKLETCHEDLQKIMKEAISRSVVDFGISEGQRNLARQHELYKKGLSRIDGINRLGKHNLTPSMAVDVYAFVQGRGNWDDAHLGYLAGVIIQVAKELLDKGEISHKLRWGGDWDSDGVIAIDHSLKDLPHYELI
jgi:peptidoglycan LD-endopeptidase CwlK